MPRGVYQRKVGRTREIGPAIRALKEAGWSHNQIAKLFDLSGHYTVTRYLNGDWNPGRKKSERLQNVLARFGKTELPK